MYDETRSSETVAVEAPSARVVLELSEGGLALLTVSKMSGASQRAGQGTAHTVRGRKMQRSRSAVTLSCGKCATAFQAWPSDIAHGGGKFCSPGCSQTSQRGGVSRSATRKEARRVWIERHESEPICWCGKRADVHHKDGNPLNNADNNHEPLCRSHHVSLENHLHPRRTKANAGVA